MRSSSCILDLCGAHDLVAEVAGEIQRRAQIDALAAQQGRQLDLHPG